MPSSPLESWTVLGDDAAPVEPIERYLAYLTDIERSPNTVKAYAHDLKDWFSFLGVRGLDWREVRLEDVGEFVAWLRLPPMVRTGAVAALPSVEHHCGEATVNRKLSAVSAFYQHAARHGVDLGELLMVWQPAGRRSTAWKPFLHHVSKGKPEARRAIRLRAPRNTRASRPSPRSRRPWLKAPREWRAHVRRRRVPGLAPAAVGVPAAGR
ncbi:site-specific integrase [Actinacidiphila soli]|uniref:site-specific integrase n=1 Tax=Actinacidiphila soli TaxID=2487275 RepID=UPI0019D2B7B7|nr:site-specific integrase [Actinacidiphila soli]